MDLTGCVALVTGGGGGLGKAVSRALAKAGADVGVTYATSRERAEKTCSAVEKGGRRAALVHMDQSDPVSVEAALADFADQFGRLDILINNAGTAKPVPFPDLDALTPDIWDHLMNTNLRGPYLVTRAATPQMRQSGGGRIVNIGAMIGLMPAGSSIAQAVSKAGVIHLTRCLGVALAPDITVNCVAPGLIEGTEMTKGLAEDYLEGMRAKSILNRSSGIDDVADQVVRFCQADSVTGQTLVIDGGIYFH